jgi:hypothetical protein
MLVKVEAYIVWDNEGFKDVCKTIKAFLMPFEIYMSPDFRDLNMRGIVLLPLRSHKGQFWRIGFFEIRDQLLVSINYGTLLPDTESIARTTLSESIDPILLPINDSSQEPY